MDYLDQARDILAHPALHLATVALAAHLWRLERLARKVDQICMALAARGISIEGGRALPLVANRRRP